MEHFARAWGWSSLLAFVCAVKGYKFIGVSSDAFANEKLQTIKALSSEVIVVPSDGGRITSHLFTRMKEETAKLAADPNTYFADKFNDRDEFAGYGELAHELLPQVRRIEVFTAAVGTAACSLKSRRYSELSAPVP
ncbi:MAG: pyridoxal-phosphate dependent enzyme [Acidobacteriales bacterium]|nr:pyridoxal-phosphate dependent enzyme [Terriglobales bacterium]